MLATEPATLHGAGLASVLAAGRVVLIGEVVRSDSVASSSPMVVKPLFGEHAGMEIDTIGFVKCCFLRVDLAVVHLSSGRAGMALTISQGLKH